MKKITIVVLHLGYGGIEKAVASLSNMLCDKYEIEIISTYKIYNTPSFDIDKRVNIKYLINDKSNRHEFWAALKSLKLITFIKESIKSIKILFLKKKLMIDAIKNINSDIIISTRTIHNEWVSKFGRKKALKIAWEHSHHNNNKKYINKLLKSVNEMDYFITVSKELCDFYKHKLNMKTKCMYIELALDSIPKENSNLNNNELTSIGRLSPEKGFLDLIDVFEIVKKKYSKLFLNIVGDGSEREKIKNKIREKGLEKHIILHGYKNKTELDKVLKNTDIYVMTSFTESFGLVLIEAMSYGVPCVAFSSAQGALEIIENEKNGFIINNRNKEEMANKIIELLKNKKLRETMGKCAKEKIELYNQINVKKKWLDLIKKRR